MRLMAQVFILLCPLYIRLGFKPSALAPGVMAGMKEKF